MKPLHAWPKLRPRPENTCGERLSRFIIGVKKVMGWVAQKRQTMICEAVAAVIDCLVALGAQGFWRSVESYLAVLDAMYDRRHFDFIMTRQEGGAAYMAAAWAS